MDPLEGWTQPKDNTNTFSDNIDNATYTEPLNNDSDNSLYDSQLIYVIKYEVDLFVLQNKFNSLEIFYFYCFIIIYPE